MEDTTIRKSMAERKTDIVEVIVNSPVGIDKPLDELVEIFERTADFVFSYESPKLTKKTNEL